MFINFNNDRYVTRGISSNVSLYLQLFLWHLIDGLKVEKDYLQVFKCSYADGKQKIEHIQEKPEYKAQYLFKADTIFIGKIFVMDDGDNSVMMLADEY